MVKMKNKYRISFFVLLIITMTFLYFGINGLFVTSLFVLSWIATAVYLIKGLT